MSICVVPIYTRCELCLKKNHLMSLEAYVCGAYELTVLGEKVHH